MKPEKKNRIPLYLWLPTGAYHKNLATWELFFLKSGEFGLFFMEHCLYRLKSYFQVEMWRNFAKKKDTGGDALSHNNI